MNSTTIINWIMIHEFAIKLLLFLISFYIFQVIIDFILWMISARVKKGVSSRINTEWTLKKWLIILFILTITILVWWITNIFNLNWQTFTIVSLIPAILMGLFNFWEFVSKVQL